MSKLTELETHRAHELEAVHFAPQLQVHMDFCEHSYSLRSLGCSSRAWEGGLSSCGCLLKLPETLRLAVFSSVCIALPVNMHAALVCVRELAAPKFYELGTLPVKLPAGPAVQAMQRTWLWGWLMVCAVACQISACHSAPTAALGHPSPSHTGFQGWRTVGGVL